MYDDNNFIHDDDGMFDDEGKMTEHDYACLNAILKQEEGLCKITDKTLAESNFAYPKPEVVKELFAFKHFLENKMGVENEIKIEFLTEALIARIIFQDPYFAIDSEIKKEFDYHFQKADSVEICGHTDGNISYCFAYDNAFLFYPKSSD